MDRGSVHEEGDVRGIDVRVARAYARIKKCAPEASFTLQELAEMVAAIREKHDVALKGLHLEDLWIAQAALRGSNQALEWIVERIERDVHRQARRSGISRADAEDAWQSILQRMLAGETGNPLASYAGRASLSLYLRTIHVRDALRRRTRRELPAREDGVPSALDQAMERERELLLGDVVASAMAQLGVTDRALLTRHHEGGEPLTEVCVELELLEPNQPHLRKLASRLHQRALRKLREHVVARARERHGIEEHRLAELVPRIETCISGGQMESGAGHERGPAA